MRRHLRILDGERLTADPFIRPPFSLALQGQRPGELCETRSLCWSQEKLASARRHASEAALPLALWLTLTVESERGLSAAAGTCTVSRDTVAAAANEAARHCACERVLPAARRLGEYAAAIRTGDPRFRHEDPSRSIVVAVPHTMLASWAIAAVENGLHLNDWIVAQDLPPGRQLWEAAAAEAGLQLDGWVLRQAISCARSRNATAHTAA
jgi:hypothetical protein